LVPLKRTVLKNCLFKILFWGSQNIHSKEIASGKRLQYANFTNGKKLQNVEIDSTVAVT
jgi:hypothetical protein